MVFHCNYGHILYRFPNKARYWLKNINFSYPCILLARSLKIVCCVKNHQKHSTFVIFDPTQPIKNCKISTQPNPRVDPTHGHLWASVCNCLIAGSLQTVTAVAMSLGLWVVIRPGFPVFETPCHVSQINPSRDNELFHF